MKLRLEHNSIRLRLNRRDVEELVASGEVTEGVSFPPTVAHPFSYTVRSAEDRPHMEVSYTGSAMVITVPHAEALEWAQGDEIGLKHVLPVRDGDELVVLIEKDLKCLGQSGDDPNAFPNPREGVSPDC